MQISGSVAVEEYVHGGTLWVGVRARGAEWSWLTPSDALQLARLWMETYGGADAASAATRASLPS
jgi:hypothetical protein